MTEPKSDVLVEGTGPDTLSENVPIAKVPGDQASDDGQPNSHQEAEEKPPTKKARRNKSASLESVDKEPGENKETTQSI